MIICSLDWQELTPLLDLAQARSVGSHLPKVKRCGVCLMGNARMPMDAHGCPILWPFELISYGKNQDSLRLSLFETYVTYLPIFGGVIIIFHTSGQLVESLNCGILDLDPKS